MVDHTHAARRLRKTMTPAESMLWKQVRRGQLGVRFRRQVPKLGYILDFLVPSVHLVIELDGAVHEASQSDWARDLALAKAGFRVLRVENSWTFDEMDRLLDEIRRLIADPEAQPEPWFA